MAKQTMGTPFHALPYRSDGGKVYRIQHPQKPLVRNLAQEKYNINDYPHGCNAVVAVISYTGMIIIIYFILWMNFCLPFCV